MRHIYDNFMDHIRPEETSEEDKVTQIYSLISRYELAKTLKDFDLFKHCKKEASDFFNI